MTTRKTTRIMPHDVRGMLAKQAINLMTGKATTGEANALARVASQIHQSATKTNKNQVMARI